MPSFEDFYRSLAGRKPFPWQRRLANDVAKNEVWPREVGVPTGLGKTVCLDIAIWWLASQADRSPLDRTASTRIWWVVNRRLLVDSTAEHAKSIAYALVNPASHTSSKEAAAVISKVAERLSWLSADKAFSPLDVIRLRGGVAPDKLRDPAQPTVVLCTLPMFGSRLLFRGYGSSSRSVDAAMAGTDSLVLLDEAHLAPHLRTLLPALAECTLGARAILGPHRSSVRMVALTATGEATSSNRFDLDSED